MERDRLATRILRFEIREADERQLSGHKNYLAIVFF